MAFDCFCAIDGIPGESTDSKHKDQIEVTAYDHTLSQRLSGSGSSGGALSSERCEHGTFNFVHTLDKASPKLALACCNGSHISKVKFELCRATGDKQTYMVYELSDVMVASVSPTGQPQGESSLPLERISLVYGAITWTYTATDHKTGKAAGNIEAHWSVTDNTGG